MPENLLTGPLALTAFRKEKITILKNILLRDSQDRRCNGIDFIRLLKSNIIIIKIK